MKHRDGSPVVIGVDGYKINSSHARFKIVMGIKLHPSLHSDFIREEIYSFLNQIFCRLFANRKLTFTTHSKFFT
jgi:hypothetical protein